MSGAQVGFFRGDIKTLVNDIQELKPTIFVSVPRLLNRLYDKVGRRQAYSRTYTIKDTFKGILKLYGLTIIDVDCGWS